MLAAITGIGGLVLGAAALAVAVRANYHAKGSATASQLSADAASDSVVEAKRANALAAEADDRARRAETRATVRNDVAWNFKLSGSRWTLRNTGLDDAHNVEVFLNIDDYNAFIALDTVRGRGGVANIYDFTEIQTRKWNEAKARIDAMARAGIGYAPVGSFEITQRVTWDDEAGNHHTTGTDRHTIS